MGDPIPAPVDFVDQNNKVLATVHKGIYIKNDDGKIIIELAQTLMLGGGGGGGGGGNFGGIGNFPHPISSQEGGIILREKTGKQRIQFDAGDASGEFGGIGADGNLVLKDKEGHTKIRFKAGEASGEFGRSGTAGRVVLKSKSGKDGITLNGGDGRDIFILDGSDKHVLCFDGDAFEGKGAALWIGTHQDDGGAKPGLIVLRGKKGKDAIELNGEAGNRIFIRDADGRHVFSFDCESSDNKVAALWIGRHESEGGGKPALVTLRNAPGRDTVVLEGGKFFDAGGKVFVNDSFGNNTIFLDGQKGDIVLTNADCAEDFDVSDSANVDPGTVVSMNDEGKLQASQEPYDRKVAGVISGAGQCKPGIVLDKQKSLGNRLPVALVGKVYCKADAQCDSIRVGDLLTTSALTGHAMKASDPLKAFGAVIGKALRPLKTGQGMIPILVALQ